MDLTSRGSNLGELLSPALMLYNLVSTMGWYRGAGESWGSWGGVGLWALHKDRDVDEREREVLQVEEIECSNAQRWGRRRLLKAI